MSKLAEDLEALKRIQDGLLDKADKELRTEVGVYHGKGRDKDAIDKGLNAVIENVKVVMSEAFQLVQTALNKHPKKNLIGPIINQQIRATPGTLDYFLEQFHEKLRSNLHDSIDVYEEHQVGSENDKDGIQTTRERTGHISKNKYIEEQGLVEEIGKILARTDHMITVALKHLQT